MFDLYRDTEELRLRKWTDKIDAAGGTHIPRVPVRNRPRVEVVTIAERYETGPVDMDQLRRDLSTPCTPSRPLNLQPKRRRGIRGLLAQLRGFL